MKRKITAIILVVALALSLGLVPAASVGASPGPGLVAQWHFDGDANDSSGNGNDGTVTGATYVSGKYGQALDFDGSGDYVDFGTNVVITTAITIEAWIKPSAFTNYDAIVANFVWPTNPEGYSFRVMANKKLVWRAVLSGNNTYSITSNSTMVAGNWYHVVLTHDASYTRLYINGSLDKQETSSGAIVNLGKALKIGWDDYAAGRVFNGTIDEVRIWDEARAPNPYGEITSPDEDEVVFGTDFEALYYDDDPGIVHWAVRQDDPNNGSKTVFGNVNGFDDSYTWDGHLFQATAATSGWTPDDYYFVFNPKEEGGEQDVRLIRHFYVGSLGDLMPTPDYNPVGTDHTVSISIGVEVAGVEVWFDIDGPNSSESGSTTTDEDGVASFTYTGNNPGTDTITAYIDLDANGLDEGDPTSTSTVTKYWLQHYVTGGGTITEGKGKTAPKITFGGNVGLMNNYGDPVGQYQINFHNVAGVEFDKGHFHTMEITSLTFEYVDTLPGPDPPDANYNLATFTATGRFNGVDNWDIEVRLTDFGEPGRDNDCIRILLWDTGNILVYDSYSDGDYSDEDGNTPTYRTKLDGGNFQIHPPEIPTP